MEVGLLQALQPCLHLVAACHGRLDLPLAPLPVLLLEVIWPLPRPQPGAA